MKREGEVGRSQMDAPEQSVSHEIECCLLQFPPSEDGSLAFEQIGHKLRDHGIVLNVLSGHNKEPKNAAEFVDVGGWYQVSNRVQVLDGKVRPILPCQLANQRTEPP